MDFICLTPFLEVLQSNLQAQRVGSDSTTGVAVLAEGWAGAGAPGEVVVGLVLGAVDQPDVVGVLRQAFPGGRPW